MLGARNLLRALETLQNLSTAVDLSGEATDDGPQQAEPNYHQQNRHADAGIQPCLRETSLLSSPTAPPGATDDCVSRGQWTLRNRTALEGSERLQHGGEMAEIDRRADDK
ncbi:UNVERIFIED_CONTAM: hypothetical protein K2H54_045806 [Gekko kuhli]